MNLRHEFQLGVVIGILMIMLGAASIGYYFSNVYNGGPDANSRFGFRYVWAGLALVGIGSIIAWQFHPAFERLKNYHSSPQVCPRCGAVVGADATACEKCNQLLQQELTA
jgi:ribosomal protein L40E